MGHPVEFHGQNKALRAHPSTADHVSPEPLPIFTNGYACVSCWQLDPVELAEVNRTGRVFISILSGESQPACFVGSEESTHRCLLAMDLGRAFERTPAAPGPRTEYERLMSDLRPAFYKAVVAAGDSQTFLERLGPALWALLRECFAWEGPGHLLGAIDTLAILARNADHDEKS